MQKYLFKNISVVNEGEIKVLDVLVEGERIERMDKEINVKSSIHEINGEGLHLFPGVIDDQVHFREPGLTHKATIQSESTAGLLGGVTSYMEMPNTIPNALTLDLLEDKYRIASQTSPANFSFYMGVSNDNSEEVIKVNKKKHEICGVKIFLGSSTGNMLVNNYQTLDRIFSQSEMLIAIHSEDENIVQNNYKALKEVKPDLSPSDHPIIRNVDACYESTLRAVKMAQQYNTRLHVLHLTTEKELALFGNMMPLKEKRITSEVCVHHLHFTAEDYETLGYQIKCNPAIKEPFNKKALWEALLDNRIDVIATDHAPHLWSEKQPPYESAHAGLPLIQHTLPLMLHYHKMGYISLERIAEKMSHAVAECFRIKDRGYIREGYYADLTVVDMHKSLTVKKENLLYKCGWSPLEHFQFPASISHTMVNGYLAYANGTLNTSQNGKRLQFDH